MDFEPVTLCSITISALIFAKTPKPDTIHNIQNHQSRLLRRLVASFIYPVVNFQFCQTIASLSLSVYCDNNGVNNTIYEQLLFI